MFLTPEERYISKGKEGRRTEQEETAPDCSGESTVRGEPIIINGPDYLLRINETRMEALVTLYRRFTTAELDGLLKENGVVYGIRKKALEELAQGKQNYEETLIAAGTAAKDGRDGFLNIILIRSLRQGLLFCRTDR